MRSTRQSDETNDEQQQALNGDQAHQPRADARIGEHGSIGPQVDNPSDYGKQPRRLEGEIENLSLSRRSTIRGTRLPLPRAPMARISLCALPDIPLMYDCAPARVPVKMTTSNEPCARAGHKR